MLSNFIIIFVRELKKSKKNIIKGKESGYTILETIIVVFMLMIILVVISNSYINLVKASILANDYYQALENVRLGTERIWRILKYGWNFNLISSSEIRFKRYLENSYLGISTCTNETIKFNQSSSSIVYCKGDPCYFQSIFDNNLVTVKNFLIATDTSDTNSTTFYFQYSPKIIVLYYDLEIKSKRGLTTSLEFQQAVAPLNSTLSTSSCP